MKNYLLQSGDYWATFKNQLRKKRKKKNKQKFGQKISKKSPQGKKLLLELKN